MANPGLPQPDFWTARLRRGPRGTFENSEELMAAANEYFDWAVKNPLQESKVFMYKGRIIRANMAKMRAFTLTGLCTYIGIHTTSLKNLREHERTADAMQIIDAIIYEQKFVGAAASLLNPMIITRDLGLADKSELTGKDGGPIETKEVSARDLLLSKLASLNSARREDGDTGDADGGAV